MIYTTQYLNEEKHRYEAKIENLYCGVLLYHFVKYDNKISDDFLEKVNSSLERYFLEDSDLTLDMIKNHISTLCRVYNVISLQIERG